MAGTVKVKGSQTVARARKGDTGNGGITYRISLWEDGKEYRNDSSLETDGVRIIDVACNMGMAMIGDSSFVARKCKITHQADHQLIPLSDNTYWEDVNQFQPIVTPVLLAQAISADYIDVNSLVAKHVQVKNGDTVVADMGGDTNYPLFLGSTLAANAKTKFDKNGNLFCNGGEFAGGLRIPFVALGNSDLTYMYSEVVNYGSSHNTTENHYQLKSTSAKFIDLTGQVSQYSDGVHIHIPANSDLDGCRFSFLVPYFPFGYDWGGGLHINVTSGGYICSDAINIENQAYIRTSLSTYRRPKNGGLIEVVIRVNNSQSYAFITSGDIPNLPWATIISNI